MSIQEGCGMKVWYDALTGKHFRYGVAIAERLRTLKHQVVLTTRKHPDTLPLAEFLEEKCTIVGRYNPQSLLSRVKEGAKRQIAFCKLFEKNMPHVAISHGSVDQCRVAFGLGIPIISTIDTPYAEPVHRLTLPISSYIVASKAIPKSILQTYNVKGEIVTFNGVDEVAWIKDFKPKVHYDYGKPLIVIREFETKAAYTTHKLDLISLARKMTRFGQVVFLSRYNRKTIRGLNVPKEFVDSATLVSQANLVIGVGGTISREAALQGTPAIIIEALPTQHVNDFLAEKGFPIFKTKQSDALKLARKLLEEKCDVTNLLDKLENPVDTIANTVGKIAQR
jgi:predicted glycosyltransferase